MTHCVFGFCFCVQSPDYDPMYLHNRIDGFIHRLEDLLDAVDDESFDSYKNGLIAQVLKKDPSLACETNRIWSQIVDRRYMFDLFEKEAQEPRSISKTDLKEWCKIYFQQSSERCCRLCVRVWGCNTKLEDVETKLQGSEML
ncbi:Nardilysin-like-like protein [Drosera capensis]